jgi:FkbM family methyltransferase
MSTCGYEAITEAHFFIPKKNNNNLDSGKKSYRIRWEMARNSKRPIQAEYADDLIEYAYILDEAPSWRTFEQGDLSGISLLMTDDYFSLYHTGYHDWEMITHLSRTNPRAKIIFDVGGFIGMSSLLFSKMIQQDCEIICFEPNPANSNRMYINFSHNPVLARNIECYEIALGDRREIMDMLCSDRVDTGYSSTSQLLAGDGTNNSRESLNSWGFNVIQVPMTTLDDFVQKTGKIPDVLKIDVEGAEALFLAGAKTTLGKYHPLLYIELHSIMAATRSIRLLSDLMYSTAILSQETDGRVMIVCEYMKSNRQTVPETNWLKYEHENLRIMLSNKLKMESKKAGLLQDELKKSRLEKETLKVHFERILEDEKSRANQVIEQIQAQNAALDAQLEQIQAANAALVAQLEQAQEINNALASQATQNQAELTDLGGQMIAAQAENTRLTAQIHAHQQNQAALQTQITELLQTIRAIQNSTSWRVTRPLRAIGGRLKGKP